ncbi:hypothetical protein HBB16_17180 [Pseudonocardia sp. MCCB 268]|nr:hypothetical protein [Pseudonocardia cytotoxica]
MILLCAGYGPQHRDRAGQDTSGGIMDPVPVDAGRGATVLARRVLASVLKNLVTTAILSCSRWQKRRSASGRTQVRSAGSGLVGWSTPTSWHHLPWRPWSESSPARPPRPGAGLRHAVIPAPYVSSAFVPPETMPNNCTASPRTSR